MCTYTYMQYAVSLLLLQGVENEVLHISKHFTCYFIVATGKLLLMDY